MSITDKITALVSLLQVYKQIQHYEQMIKTIKKLIGISPKLTQNQINLFSFAYKKYLNQKRISWIGLKSLLNKQQKQSKLKGQDVRKQLEITKSNIQKFMKDICDEVIDTIDQKLIPKAENQISLAYYHKIKGDYYRYLTQFSKVQDKNCYKQKAEKSYNQSVKSYEKNKFNTNFKYGLLLNQAIFYYEVFKDVGKALEIAQKCLKQKNIDLENSNIRLLESNVELWNKAKLGKNPNPIASQKK